MRHAPFCPQHTPFFENFISAFRQRRVRSKRKMRKKTQNPKYTHTYEAHTHAEITICIGLHAAAELPGCFCFFGPCQIKYCCAAKFCACGPLRVAPPLQHSTKCGHVWANWKLAKPNNNNFSAFCVSLCVCVRENWLCCGSDRERERKREAGKLWKIRTFMSSCDNIRLQLRNLQSNGSSFWFCTKKYATISNKSKQVGTVCQALSKRHIKRIKIQK